MSNGTALLRRICTMAKLIDKRIGALNAYQSGDALVVEWDYIEEMQDDTGLASAVHPYPRPIQVEVRIGESWIYSHFVCRHWCRRLIIREHWTVGTQTVFVRPLALSGWYADKAESVDVTMVAPPAHPSTGTRDEHSLGWPGTKTDTDTDGDGDLVLSATKLAGTYLSPEIDLGEPSEWRVGIRLKQVFTDSGFTWDSLETTWDELTRTWDEVIESWNALAPSWDSVAIRERDWIDNIYNPRAGVILKASVYMVSGNPGTYQRHVPGAHYYGRYLRFEITLLRADADDHVIEITECQAAWSRNLAGADPSYGSMYNHDTPTAVEIADIGVAVRIPEGFSAGQAHGTTFQNDREHAISFGGKFEIHWSISFTCAAANQDIEGFVMIDNVMDVEASAHRTIGTGTDIGCISGTCTLALSAGAVIALGVLNETAVNDITIEHANMSFERVGL